MEYFETVIIGAGPAGLNCAKVLGDAKKRVLVLEKNEVVGPKVCAGGLTGHDLEYLNIPAKLLDHRYKEVTLHTPFDKDVVHQDYYFVYTVDRKNLGQWQLKQLGGTTAVVRTKAKVTCIGKNYIIVNGSEKIRFKYLVGADGSASMVRNYVGLKNDKIGLAIQYIIRTKKYKKLELFFDSSLFHSWYAWIFPHKDYVSVGAGADPKYLSSKTLRENFAKWLEKNKIDVSKGEYQAHPINADYKGFRFGNTFLVGDAAGLASGLTGEGIYQALISGDEIARIIIDKKYVSARLAEIIKTKQVHERILSFFEKSGPVREIEYELLALLLKSKLVDKKLISVLA